MFNNNFYVETTLKMRSHRNALRQFNDRLKNFAEMLNDDDKENRMDFDDEATPDENYANYKKFWVNMNVLDSHFTRAGTSKQSENEINSYMRYAKKFITTISQVLLYEAVLHLETISNDRIQIVDVENLNKTSLIDVDFTFHRCTDGCRPLIEPRFVLGENIFLLPFKCGYRRGIIKNNQGVNQVAYVSPCGAVLTTMDQIKKYLIDTESTIDADSFVLSVNVEPRRRYVVDASSIKHEVNDLTNGVELAIECVNEINNRSICIDDYIAKSVFCNGISSESLVDDIDYRCDCADDCSTDECDCRRKNESNLGYDFFGRLSVGVIPSWIHECRSSCACQAKKCRNNLIQRPRSSLLQVFMTRNKRWGVRSLVDLPKGFFVAVCAGLIVKEEFAENYGKNVTDQYIFDLPRFTTTDGEEEQNFSLELSVKANISKIFNHSCDPNMFLQTVVGHCKDKRFPTLALFTWKNVVAGDELTFDYNYQLSKIVGKEIKCYCGSNKCRQRLR